MVTVFVIINFARIIFSFYFLDFEVVLGWLVVAVVVIVAVIVVVVVVVAVFVVVVFQILL